MVDIKTKITVDNSEAKRKIKETATSADNASRKASSGGGGGASGGGGWKRLTDKFGMTEMERRQLAADAQRVRAQVAIRDQRRGVGGAESIRNQNEAMRAVIDEARSKARSIGRDIADEIGKKAGPAIGKFVAGFVAHEGLSLAFKLSKNPLGGNNGIELAENSVNGAVAGGTAGAMIGGPIGAAIGGVLGGLSSLISTIKDQSDARIQERYSRKYGDAVSYRGINAQKEDMAFSKYLQGMSHEGRLWELGKRRDVLKGLVEDADNQLDAEGIDHTTKEFKELKDLRQELFARLASVEGQFYEEKMNIPIGRMVDAGNLADSYTKKGLAVGAQVDVTDVNSRILAKLTEAVGYFKNMSNIVGKIPTLTKPDVRKEQNLLGGQSSPEAIPYIGF